VILLCTDWMMMQRRINPHSKEKNTIIMTQTSTQNDEDVNITSEQPNRNQSQQSSSPQILH